MYSHMMVGANDMDAAKTFYDALFGALEVKPGKVDDKGRVFYAGPTGMFAVTAPINGEAATHGNGATVGFACSSAEQVEKWHAAGVAAGGTSCEDPPGIRASGIGDIYLAYLRDPTGNKLCAMYYPR